MGVQGSSFTNVSAVNMFWARHDGLVLTDDLTGDAGLQWGKVFVFEARAATFTAPASLLNSLDSGRISPPRASDPWLVSLRQVPARSRFLASNRESACTSTMTPA